jgi:hypothetical protein
MGKLTLLVSTLFALYSPRLDLACSPKIPMNYMLSVLPFSLTINATGEITAFNHSERVIERRSIASTRAGREQGLAA